MALVEGGWLGLCGGRDTILSILLPTLPPFLPLLSFPFPHPSTRAQSQHRDDDDDGDYESDGDDEGGAGAGPLSSWGLRVAGRDADRDVGLMLTEVGLALVGAGKTS